MGFYGGFMGFCGGLMGFCGASNGIYWELPSGRRCHRTNWKISVL